MKFITSIQIPIFAPELKITPVGDRLNNKIFEPGEPVPKFLSKREGLKGFQIMFVND